MVGSVPISALISTGTALDLRAQYKGVSKKNYVKTAYLFLNSKPNPSITNLGLDNSLHFIIAMQRSENELLITEL